MFNIPFVNNFDNYFNLNMSSTAICSNITSLCKVMFSAINLVTLRFDVRSKAVILVHYSEIQEVKY